MPKLTFYNLPEEKQKRLMFAIKKEFSRVPLFEASISNIVKEAEIPRGSFYQYFEDKTDAFFFLLQELMEAEKYHFIYTLKRNEGDIFTTVTDFFQRLIDDEENYHFFKHSFLNLTYQVEKSFASMINFNTKNNEDYQKMLSFIDTTDLNVTNEKELYHLLQIIKSILFRNLVQTFALQLEQEEAMDLLLTEINLLKRGLHKEQVTNPS